MVVERIESIDADGFEGATATVYDPEGRRVLAVSGLRGRSSLLRLFRTLLAGGNIVIVIPHARVEHADVEIISDEHGVPSLARAFIPRPSSAPRAPSAVAPEVQVWMPDVQVGTAHVKGSIAGLQDLDIDLAKVQSSVLAGTERTSIKVDRYSVNARGLTASTLQGTSATFIEMPSSTGKNLRCGRRSTGFLAMCRSRLVRGSMARSSNLAADVPRARPDAVRAFFPAWPIFDDVGAHVQAKGPPGSLALKGAATVG